MWISFFKCVALVDKKRCCAWTTNNTVSKSTETSINFYQATLRRMSEDVNIHQHCYCNVKTRKITFYSQNIGNP